MKKTSVVSYAGIIFAALLVSFLVIGPAQAQTTYVWSSGTAAGTTDWSMAANWNPSTNYPGSISTSDTASFGDPTGLNTTANLSAPIAINQLLFSAPTAAGYTITAGTNAYALTLGQDNSGGASAISASNTNGINTIGANIVLGTSTNGYQFSQAAGGNLVLSGAISGGAPTSGLIFAGGGKLTLAGTNSFAGSVTISSGTVSLGSASALTVSNTVAMSPGATLSMNSAITIAGLTGSGAVIGNGTALTLAGSNMSTTYGGMITGLSQLTLGGAGPQNNSNSQFTLSGSVMFTSPSKIDIKAGDTLVLPNAYSVTGGSIQGDTTGYTTLILSDPNALAHATGLQVEKSTLELLHDSSAAFNVNGGTSSISVTGDNTSIFVGSLSGSTSGRALALSGTVDVGASGNNILTINGYNGYTLNLPALCLAYTKGFTLAPASANVIVGAVTNITAGTSGLILGGSALSNSVTGAISDGAGANTTSLTVSGSGSWLLSGNNTYTGATTVSSGVLVISGSLGSTPVTVSGGALQLKNSAALGSSSVTFGPSGGTLALLNDKTVTFGPSGGSAYNIVVSSNASIDVDHSTSSGTVETLTLGNVAFTGTPTTLTLLNGNGYSLGMGTLTCPAGTTNQYLNNNMTGGTATFAALTTSNTKTTSFHFGGTSPTAVTSMGAIIQNGSYPMALILSESGTTVLTGANTFTGGMTVNSGTLAIQSVNGLTGTNTLFVNAGAAILSAANSYSGATKVYGTLQLASTGATGTSAITVYNGGTLQLRNDTNNANLGNFTIDTGGTASVDVDKLSTGTGLTLSLGTVAFGAVAGSDSLIVTNNAGANKYNLTIGAITFTAAAENPTFVNNMANGTLNLPVITLRTASNTTTFSGTSSTAVTTVGAMQKVSGAYSNAVVMNGAGILVFSPSGALTFTYSGGTTVSSGVLDFASTYAKPSIGTTTVAASATLALGVGSAGPYFSSSAVDALFQGNMNLVTNSSASFVGIDTTNVSGGTFNYSVPASTMGLAKLGANTLVLSGSNSYSGGTRLIAGTLILTNTAGSATGSGAVTLNGGTLGLGVSSGTITGLVQAGSGPHAIAPAAGLLSGYGTLNLIGGLTTNANSTLLFNMNSSSISSGLYGGDLINLGGSTLNAAGGGSIAFVGAMSLTTTGDYRLFDNIGGSSSGLNNLLPSQSGYTYSWSTTADSPYVDLVVGIAPPSGGTWTHNGNGYWSTQTNWQGNNLPPSGGTATFGSSISTSATITLDTSPTLAALIFDNSAAGYTLTALGHECR